MNSSRASAILIGLFLAPLISAQAQRRHRQPSPLDAGESYSLNGDSRKVVMKRYPGIGALKFILKGGLEYGPDDFFSVAILSGKPQRIIQRIPGPCKNSSGHNDDASGAIDLRFEDYNFDGLPDLEFLCNLGSPNGTFQIWLYEPERRRFYSNKTMVFSNPMILRREKQIYSESHCCMTTYSHEYFRFEENMFTLDLGEYQECEYLSEDNADVCRHVTRERVEGKMKTTKDRCEVEIEGDSPKTRYKRVKCTEGLKQRQMH